MPARLPVAAVAAAIALGSAAHAQAAPGEIKPIKGLRGVDSGGPLLNQANGIAISPDGRHVYVAAQLSDSVNAFRRNSATGKLRFVESERDGQGGVLSMDGPRDVTVSPDGRHVYVVATNDSGLTEFDRNAKSGRLSYSEQEVDGVNNITYMDSPEQVAVSPDGRQVYVTSLTDDGVVFFNRDEPSDSLMVSGEFSSNDNHNGPSGLAISPDGDTVVVGGYQGDEVAVYERSAGTGFLTFRDGLQDGLLADGLDGVRGIAFNRAGTRVFFAGSGEDAVSWYAYDPQDHSLTYGDDLTPNPETFALGDPYGVATAGKDVYVASRNGGAGGGALGAYRVFGGTVLNEFDSVLDDAKAKTLGAATEVVASPDGAHLYVSAGSSVNDDDDAVTALARDQRLKLKVTARRKQSTDSPRAKVRCSTPCRIVARAKAGGDSSKRVRKRLAAEAPRKLRLMLPAGAEGDRGKITVRARDGFGEKISAVRKVKIG